MGSPKILMASSIATTIEQSCSASGLVAALLFYLSVHICSALSGCRPAFSTRASSPVTSASLILPSISHYLLPFFKSRRLAHLYLNFLHSSLADSAKKMSAVSIGDAFLLAKLALKLGRAFTTGRKSAPAEFREVESQLYSISTALSSLDAAYKSTGITVNVGDTRLAPFSRDDQRNGENALRYMLEGCEETLKHLEKVVEKYTVISQPRNPEAPLLRKWSRDLRNNWKKVLWTTEGGDLATLRSSLTVHINCLNLVLGVAN